MTFSTYATRFEEEILPLKAKATQATMKSHLRLLTEALGRQALKTLDQRTVQKFFTKLAASMAPHSVRNIWGTLRVVLVAADSEGLVGRMPKPVLPKVKRVEQEWLTTDEMKEVIAAAEGQDKAFYAMLAETGLRIGEAVGLAVMDVNLEAQTLTVCRSAYQGVEQDPKSGNAYRTLAMSAWLRDLLAPYVEFQEPDSFIFRTRSGSPWWPGEVLKRFQALCAQLEIEPVGWHAWRRGNATAMCSVLGVPLKIADYRQGHASQGLTLGVYAQSFIGMDQEWAEKIAVELH